MIQPQTIGVICTIVLWLISFGCYAGDIPKNIKIFYSQEHLKFADYDRLIFVPQVELYDLSLLQNIEAQLSSDLSSDPETAVLEAMQLIDDNLTWLKDQLHRAFRARILIAKYQIDKLPAAVIDDAHIVYGTSAIEQISLKWHLQSGS